ncbi:MAG: DegT/DnrJ/EryC1/StrS family aminotransferase [Alcaligenaceae bacterium]|nr:MAG: DegT/DnrJ/EryC1/StrS family aminotransferase [Alcaligenaceae bacterium]
MKIPFLDLQAGYLEIKEEVDAAVARVLQSGRYVQGAEVEDFETEFATYCSSKYAITVANGLDAIHLTLRALEIGPGDEVIVPSNTFIATWLAVSHCGATVVPVEPDLRTYNIEAETIERAITAKTKAIIPVHLYGTPANIGAINNLANGRGIRVIEDAAQAHGARYKGERIGAHSDCVAWSFYPGKNLGALGDGGAVTTDDLNLANRLRALRNYGSSEKYVHEIVGFNSRLDPIQAAVLRVKLKVLDDWNGRRRKLAAFYLSGLSDAELVLPEIPSWVEPVWHIFPVRTKNRDKLRSDLLQQGIETLIHYPIPPHRQNAYRSAKIAAHQFPAAEEIASTILSLPIGPQMRHEEAETVIKAVRMACDLA